MLGGDGPSATPCLNTCKASNNQAALTTSSAAWSLTITPTAPAVLCAMREHYSCCHQYATKAYHTQQSVSHGDKLSGMLHVNCSFYWYNTCT